MTDATDAKPTNSSSRRALLAGVLGGIGAWAASAIGRASPVRAGVDGDVVLGASNNTTLQTMITNTAGGNAFVGLTGDGFGLAGLSTTNLGVYGSSSTNAAVYGQSTSSTGLLGSSGPGSPPAAKPKSGVYGYANQDAGSKGVFGKSPKGHGVHGVAYGGVGVYASAKGGYALRSSGRVTHDKVSGVATIPAGTTGVTVSPGVAVTNGSFVLLTPRSRLYGRDLWYLTQPAAGTFRIRISTARSNPTKVAWLLLG